MRGLLVLIGFIGFHASAHELSIFDFALISAEDVWSLDCDFQGSFVAGNYVRLEAFALGTELNEKEKSGTRAIIGGNFSFKGGRNDLEQTSVAGNATFTNMIQSSELWVNGAAVFAQVTMPSVLRFSHDAPALRDSDVRNQIKTTEFSNKEQIDSLAQQMRIKSAEYARLEPTDISGFEYAGTYTYIVLRASSLRSLNVFSVEELTWRSAKGIKIVGVSPGPVIINVLGKSPNMVQKSLVLDKKMPLSRILLNFPEAQEMTIANSGSDKGVPTVLAPFAKVHHYSNLIAGSLFVRSYDGWYPHSCGQINHHACDRFQGE